MIPHGGNAGVGVEEVEHGECGYQLSNGAGGVWPWSGRQNAGSSIRMSSKNMAGHGALFIGWRITASPCLLIQTR
jgi:hypothetical protein